MKSAVLLIIFNRPDKTRQVFQAIRQARPPRLYVAADGPRPSRPGEVERCAQARAIIELVDWPCDVRTRFLDGNVGCKRGVTSAIDWFFDQEGEGIILEDDVLPQPGFFAFCDELLERYRDDERVAAISGCNFIQDRHRPQASYFFSRYCHIWGWATWSRAWRKYDVNIADWPKWTAGGGPVRALGSEAAARFWQKAFESVHSGRVDTWDFQWQYACLSRGALCAVPARNQTENLGFDADATHTTAGTPDFVAQSPSRPLDFPLVHPGEVRRDVVADRTTDAHVYRYSRLPGWRDLFGRAGRLFRRAG
jgi:hypothetical protein